VFEKVLIANRGEIACRVMRTARRMGIRTVAVYSEADAGALHVVQADEAHPIGPPPASASYLKIAAILDAAEASGAQAIHPGYGFLSENAVFAEACAAKGLVFIGPPADAIRAMGSKSAAKEIMEKAGVPLVPGYHGESQRPKILEAAAREIGFPVLVKASAGGGGKGMRIVERPEDLADGVAAAKREAASAFGDDRVLIEKYLVRPRHIEMQVFADTHGNFVHLFERDCSIQRRHQKVVEEAPAPGMTEERRAEMAAAAELATRAIGYVGAGTVEMIADRDGAFYFMEMNTRLQVEHPVTEMITGQDLVEWQFRVAAGEPLPAKQGDLAVNGHAIEVRLYAEDPGRDFLPATGRLIHLVFPPDGAHTRVDTGVRQDDRVTIHYDPMIAKVVVWDRDRDAAVRRLRSALDSCEVAGVTTNLAFLSAVADHPAFARAEIDTGFIARHRDALVPAAEPASDRALALACLGLLLARNRRAVAGAVASGDPHSPWHRTDGWRLNDDNYTVVRFRDGSAEVAVTIFFRADGYRLDLPSGSVVARGADEGENRIVADLDGARCRATVIRHGDEVVVLADGRTHRLQIHDPAAEAESQEVAAGGMTAPMPGKIVALMATPGSHVKKGKTLLVMEAMKMEHAILAPADGTVERFRFEPGDQVEEGAELIDFAAAEDD